MKQTEKSYTIARIHHTLAQLGANTGGTGIFQVAYAVYLAYRHPDYIVHSSVRLYPRVASHYGLDRRTAERNIRREIRDICIRNPALTRFIMPLTPDAFITSIALHLRLNDQVSDLLPHSGSEEE